MDSGPLSNQALQVLIKSKKNKSNYTFKFLIDLINDTFIIITFSVLKAINEDSPTVPTLLTDYILKGEYYILKLMLFTIFFVFMLLIKYYKIFR